MNARLIDSYNIAWKSQISNSMIGRINAKIIEPATKTPKRAVLS
jgi:hypothetical protein